MQAATNCFFARKSWRWQNHICQGIRLFHFDLYRLNDPQELEYIGLRELVGEQDVICLIEWPDKGGEEVPNADLTIKLEYHGDSRTLECQAESTKGQQIIANL